MGGIGTLWGGVLAAALVVRLEDVLSLAHFEQVGLITGGIFVVDVRHWRGRASVRGGVLREDGHSREVQVRDAAEAAAAVATLVPTYAEHVRPVLCIAGPILVRGVTDGVLLCSHHHHRAHDDRYLHERTPSGDLRFHRRR